MLPSYKPAVETYISEFDRSKQSFGELLTWRCCCCWLVDIEQFCCSAAAMLLIGWSPAVAAAVASAATDDLTPLVSMISPTIPQLCNTTLNDGVCCCIHNTDRLSVRNRCSFYRIGIGDSMTARSRQSIATVRWRFVLSLFAWWWRNVVSTSRMLL